MTDFYEDDEDPAVVIAAYERGRKLVTEEPRRPLRMLFDARVSITGNRLVQAFASKDVQAPKFSRTS